MKRDYLEAMSDAEISEYARVLGVVLAPATSREEMVRLIEGKRERHVTVELLGMPFDVPLKAASDQRVSDLLEKPGRTDAETYEAMRLMLGDTQMATLIDACTDEDGTVDAVALGVAFVRLITSDELKN